MRCEGNGEGCTRVVGVVSCEGEVQVVREYEGGGGVCEGDVKKCEEVKK